VTPYGRSKIESERIVIGTAGLDWMILRPGVVYGPGDRAMLPLFRLSALGVLPLVGRRDAAYTVVHVADVVRAIDAALPRAGGNDTLFVGHPHPVTARELLEAVRTAVGRPAVIVPIPSAFAGMAAPVCDAAGRLVGHPLALNRARYAELMAEGFVCRVDRLRDRLGVAAEVDLREGLAETAAWYRRQGWL
jgi:nucleoside-diphosphate-sugar epimerase